MNPYQKGDVVRCFGRFTNESTGALMDPDVVKFAIKDPVGTTTISTYLTDANVIKDSVGLYHVDVNADIVGYYKYRFYSTGAGKAADEEPFFVEQSDF